MDSKQAISLQSMSLGQNNLSIQMEDPTKSLSNRLSSIQITDPSSMISAPLQSFYQPTYPNNHVTPNYTSQYQFQKPASPVDTDDEEEEDQDPSDETQASQALACVPQQQNYSFAMQTPMMTMSQSPQFHTVFNVDFADGYTFRQLFEFSKVSVSCAPMFFQEDSIYVERDNGSHTLLLRCKINSRDLTGYKVEPTLFNDPDKKRHVIVFDLTEFQIQIKSIAKKEGLRIFQYAEYPQYVFGHPYGGNKNGQGVITFITQRYEHATYNIKDGITNETQPNAVISLPAFCNACSNVLRAKYPYAIFYVYPKGFYMTSGNQTGSTCRENNWGDCSGYVEVKGSNPFQMVSVQPFVSYVPLNVVKALVKTSNFHSSGIVRIYSTVNQLVRIEIPIGCYAEVVLLIRGKNPNEMLTDTRKTTKAIK